MNEQRPRSGEDALRPKRDGKTRAMGGFRPTAEELGAYRVEAPGYPGMTLVPIELLERLAASPGPDLREADLKLLANAILGGMSYKPHREAAERVLAALSATPRTEASDD